jgi:hypothetical protein
MNKRRVKFIRALVVNEVEAVDRLEYYPWPPMPDHADWQMVQDESTMVNVTDMGRVDVPIIQLNRINRGGQKEETFLAYSRDVEQLLAMPFSALHNESVRLSKRNERLAAELDRVTRAFHEAGLWQRIREVFKREEL